MKLVSHPDMVGLHPTSGHPEAPGRLAALLDAFPDYEEAVPAAPEDVQLAHLPEHIARVRGVTREEWLDGDTVCFPSSYEAALLAAGAAVAAAEQGGFALVRPPGHHALGGRAMGFCLFNSVAVAARVAQLRLGHERVAIVDWDVHHGNGTEAIFWSDPTVLYVSVHQWPFYPGTGGPEDQEQTTVNVPLPAGAGDREYERAFTEAVEPAVRAFAPDLLLVSAGFDPDARDPLASMRMSAAGFRSLAARCRTLAPHVAAVLEGGYDLQALVEGVGETLAGFSEG